MLSFSASAAETELYDASDHEFGTCFIILYYDYESCSMSSRLVETSNMLYSSPFMNKSTMRLLMITHQQNLFHHLVRV